MLGPAFEERGAEPFATGGFSDVYEATLSGRLVAIKTLKVSTTANPRKLHRVSGSVPKPLKVVAHTGLQAPRQGSRWMEVAPTRELSNYVQTWSERPRLP
jgi:hypothetical protein